MTAASLAPHRASASATLPEGLVVLHPAHARQSARIARGSSRRASAPQLSASPAPVRRVSPAATAARPAAPSAPVNELRFGAPLRAGEGIVFSSCGPCALRYLGSSLPIVSP